MTSRRTRRGKKRKPKIIPREAFTVPEFCEAHRISRATFYNAKNRGVGPAVANVLGRVIITAESAAKWRAERTAMSEAGK